MSLPVEPAAKIGLFVLITIFSVSVLLSSLVETTIFDIVWVLSDTESVLLFMFPESLIHFADVWPSKSTKPFHLALYIGTLITILGSTIFVESDIYSISISLIFIEVTDEDLIGSFFKRIDF